METSNNTKTQTGSSQPPTPEITEQVGALQRFCVILLIANLLIGGALGLFLLRQDRNMGRQIVELTRFVNDFDANVQPKVKWYVSTLQAFAKTNADFNPILAKYNLLPTNAQPTAPNAQPQKK